MPNIFKRFGCVAIVLSDDCAEQLRDEMTPELEDFISTAKIDILDSNGKCRLIAWDQYDWIKYHEAAGRMVDFLIFQDCQRYLFIDLGPDDTDVEIRGTFFDNPFGSILAA